MIRRENKNRLVAWLPEQHINGIVIASSKAVSLIEPHIDRTPRDSNEPQVGLLGRKQRISTGVTRSPETDKRTFRLCRTTANIASSRELGSDGGSATYHDRA